MNTRDKAAADELRQALGDARRAAVKILDSSRDLLADVVVLRLEEVWTGRFHLQPKRALPEYCPNHPSIRNPCGLCQPPREDHD